VEIVGGFNYINKYHELILMGNTNSIRKYNFEQMQSISNTTIIINTLPNTNQNCLILNTIKNTEEENIINNLLKTNKKVDIIIYGMNCNDESIYNYIYFFYSFSISY
jgi:hypothetical protein